MGLFWRGIIGSSIDWWRDILILRFSWKGLILTFIAQASALARIVSAAVLVAFSFGAPPVFAQELTVPAYVGSQACADCHSDATESWTGSDHALAWTAPTAENIVADFDGTEFTHDGMLAQFRIDGGRHFVTVTENDGATTDYPVHSVAGIEPLQQYLLETEPGRLQSFDVVWDTEQKTWFHLYPDQVLPPDDGLHWTGPYKNWNARCAECHATGFEKNYDPESGTYSSTQAEMGVGCESCHGPAAVHLAWTKDQDISGWDGQVDAVGLTMAFDGAESTIQQCAGCHSRREAQGQGNPLPGTPYHDAYNLAQLRPGLYHADGQILDEVYVYGSFLQSKMYARGVGCTNCHNAHSTDLKAEGNAVCTQCHSQAGNAEFSTLKPAIYDSPEHHFHTEGSEGAQCKSCHMVEQVYMGVDGRRDHSFRIPRPDLAGETGSPDACTTCHQDQSADWAASQIADWYPASQNRGPHYGQTLAKGRANPVAAAGALSDLAADADQPGIVRATALWLLEQSGDPAVAERFVPLLSDPDPVIRTAAIGLQRLAPDQDRVLRLVDLLADPIQTVRIIAARQLVDAPIARLPQRMAANLRIATSEWRQSLANRFDFPETHLQLGGIALAMRNPPAAITAFREVVSLDPQRIDAWVMLVRIAAATEGLEATRTVLADALEINPNDPSLLQFAEEIRTNPNSTSP